MKKGTTITIINSFLLTTDIFQVLGIASLLLLYFPHCHGLGILKSSRKLAWGSPTTTPTLYHILSLGKERKREDKGNEQVDKGNTTRRPERA